MAEMTEKGYDQFREARSRIESLSVLFDTYFESAFNSMVDEQKYRSLELRSRIWQLGFSLDNVYRVQPIVSQSIQNLAVAATAHQSKIDALLFEHDEYMRQLRFYVEAFYLYSGIVMGLLNNLPGFPKYYFEPVAKVRNHLIVHPKTFAGGFTVGLPEGPQLKVSREDGVNPNFVFQDPGLFKNCIDFCKDVESSIVRFLGAPEAG
jgi:hypothetical protein